MDSLWRLATSEATPASTPIDVYTYISVASSTPPIYNPTVPTYRDAQRKLKRSNHTKRILMKGKGGETSEEIERAEVEDEEEEKYIPREGKAYQGTNSSAQDGLVEGDPDDPCRYRLHDGCVLWCWSVLRLPGL